MVPLIEAGNKGGSKKRNCAPAQCPLRIAHPWKGGAKGAKKQNAQDGVSHHVASLANVEVPVLKPIPVHAEKEMQEGIKKPAGIVGRE